MTCTKVSFINEKYADEYVAKLKKTSYRKVKPIRSYLCEKCLTWHLTSTTNRDNERLQKLERKITEYKNIIRNLNEAIKQKNDLIYKLKNRL